MKLSPHDIDFDSLPDCAYVRLPTVMVLFGVSRSTVWRCVGKAIPTPRKLSSRVTCWNVGELRNSLSKKNS